MPSGAVTLAVTTQVPLDGMVDAPRLMLPDPGAAVAAPEQLFVRPFGDATVRPAGVASAKATPVGATKLLGFRSEKLTTVVRPGRNLFGRNVFVMTGGATTSSVAEAAFPAPATFALTLLVVLFFTPGLVPV